MLIDQYKAYLQNELNLSPHTVDAYSRDVSEWAEWLTDGDVGKLRPEQVTSGDVRVWLAGCARKGLSSVSVRRKTQSLRSFYRYLAKRHGVTVNPASEIKLAKVAKPLPAYVPEDEMAQLVEKKCDGATEFEQKRNQLILLMLYSTGMRRAELRELRDEDINLSRGELKVLGKRNKERMIPFGKELSEAIREYVDLRRRSTGEARSERFFVRPNGAPLYDKLIYNVVHQAMIDEGVHSARLSPHVMRHSFATDMLNNGASLSAVQHLLGHESLATTQVYTHITYRELQQNYQHAHPRAKK
ncbi:MAG: tyrosine-type recombinase/integrase [Muribaculaceae bacterium]|nr:tyrosine-type recombinase/integrase [Muribaculaceae bacterium]